MNISVPEEERRTLFPHSEKRTLALGQLSPIDRLLEKSALDAIDRIQQQILKTPGETRDPCKALTKAYEKLTEEQKIAFLLSGGFQKHFPCQRKKWLKNKQKGTGDLPVLC